MCRSCLNHTHTCLFVSLQAVGVTDLSPITACKDLVYLDIKGCTALVDLGCVCVCVCECVCVCVCVCW